MYAKVRTLDGWKEIGSLKVGDQLVHPEGGSSSVVQIHEQGVQDIYELEFIDGAKTWATLDHLWKVRYTRNTKGKDTYIVKSTKEILAHYKFNQAKDGSKRSNIVIPFSKSVKFGQQIEDAYLIGLLIGDGGFTGTNVLLTTADLEIAKFIEALSFKVVKYSNYGYCINGFQGRLRKLGLFGLGSFDKFIPQEFKVSNIETRWNMLRGLMDTDGYIDKRGHCIFTSVSPQLAKDVQEIVWSLGGKATITIKRPFYRKNGRKIQGKLAYNVYIRVENTKDLFRLSRKRKRSLPYNGGYSNLNRRLKSISYIGKEEARCITINKKDGLYITDDYIVTHNSYWLRWYSIRWLIKTFAETKLEGLTAALFSEDYPTLKDRHVGKLELEVPSWLGTLKEDKAYGLCVRLDPAFGNGVLLLRNLDDPSKYMCFHPGTEILTEDGFKLVEQVQKGEKVATFDPETRQAEFQPVKKVWAYDFDGELVATRGGKDHVAFTVTPNHELVARTARGSLKKYRVDSLPAEFYIPRSAVWSVGALPDSIILTAVKLGRVKKPLTIPIVPWLKFLGWFIAEGCTEKGRYAVVISQKKRLGLELLRRDLADFPYKFHFSPRGASCNGKALYNILSAYGDSYTKRIPRDILNLHPLLLRHLFDSLIAGDGSVTQSGQYVYVTVSVGLADDVSELAIKLGYVPTITKVMGLGRKIEIRGKQYQGADVYRIYISKRGDTRVKRSNLQRLKYLGKVYCVTVPPYGTVLTRFNNRVMWSGQSSEFALMAVDELTKNQEEVFSNLRARLRWPGLGGKTRFIAGTNPGNIGHEWVKKRWIDRAFPAEEQEPDEFAYVPAKADDNPYIDPSYLRALESLPERMRKALREGSWDITEGMFFTEFDKTKHVVETTAFKDIPSNWPKIRMIDVSGRNGTTACYWVAIDGDGNAWIYREYWMSGCDSDQHAENIWKVSHHED